MILFRLLAEIARDYLKKGAKIYIEGKLQTRKWQDKTTGQDRFTTEIVGNELQMLDSRADKAPVVAPTSAAAMTESSDDFDSDSPF